MAVTFIRILQKYYRYGHIAQWVEGLPLKQRQPGSIPRLGQCKKVKLSLVWGSRVKTSPLCSDQGKLQWCPPTWVESDLAAFLAEGFQTSVPILNRGRGDFFFFSICVYVQLAITINQMVRLTLGLHHLIQHIKIDLINKSKR